MKTLIVEEKFNGRKTEINTKNTYQTDSGKWTAEVDGTEFNRACLDLCSGIKDCNCEDLHVMADQDDDGKEYTVLSS